MVPQQIRKIYSQFDAVSLEHALVYSVVVKLTLKEVAKHIKDSHPDLSKEIIGWADDIKRL